MIKGPISKISGSIFPEVPFHLKKVYYSYKFNQNIYRIFSLAVFLCIEQAVYALFITQAHSKLQKVYFIISFTMAVIAAVSLYYLKTRSKKRTIHLFHKFFELIPGLVGIAIILMRLFLVNFDGVRLPTIYLAVIYVLSVFFYLSYLQSFILYLFLSVCVIVLLPAVYPDKLSQIILADIISNGILAWFIAVIQYSRFVRIFLNASMIEDANKRLEEKNSEISKMNEELKHISTYDSLTSIYNRRKLEEALTEEVSLCRRYHNDFALILLDVDHFKLVNDTHGHDVGDEVLKTIARLIQENVRELDICGRWGGEEFLIIVRQSSLDQAAGLAERIRSGIETHNMENVSRVTVSLGVAAWTEAYNREELLKLADHRLYKAKIDGRNRVRKE